MNVSPKKDFEIFEERFEAFAERTEENFRRVWQTINELAEAQKRTEERLNELAEAQKKSEERLNRLEQTVAELAEAQKRTEERLNELAEAQKRTEERLNSFEKQTEENFNRVWQTINELAEAQRETERILQGALKRLDRVEERLEGLSDTVGYTLENRSYKSLPKILADYGLKVEGRLLRRYVKLGKKDCQINIYGYGRRHGERILIVGETKVRPSKKEISRFERLCELLSQREGLPVFKIFVAHDFPPTIEEELHRREILPIWSYDLE